ncbi:Trm112 family protein [Rheinheimera sp.]|uniref:Trm112 family protein n=1 Tax=Rheinheimera sp. TaxID=1869214 RepID=UPI00307EA7EF
MALNVALLDIIACPLCKGKLKLDKDKQELICVADRLAYPIRQHIPVLLVNEARPLTLDEADAWRS